MENGCSSHKSKPYKLNVKLARVKSVTIHIKKPIAEKAWVCELYTHAPATIKLNRPLFNENPEKIRSSFGKKNKFKQTYASSHPHCHPKPGWVV
jgi:hypothetical protein